MKLTQLGNKISTVPSLSLEEANKNTKKSIETALKETKTSIAHMIDPDSLFFSEIEKRAIEMDFELSKEQRTLFYSLNHEEREAVRDAIMQMPILLKYVHTKENLQSVLVMSHTFWSELIDLNTDLGTIQLAKEIPLESIGELGHLLKQDSISTQIHFWHLLQKLNSTVFNYNLEKTLHIPNIDALTTFLEKQLENQEHYEILNNLFFDMEMVKMLFSEELDTPEKITKRFEEYLKIEKFHINSYSSRFYNQIFSSQIPEQICQVLKTLPDGIPYNELVVEAIIQKLKPSKMVSSRDTPTSISVHRSDFTDSRTPFIYQLILEPNATLAELHAALKIPKDFWHLLESYDYKSLRFLTSHAPLLFSKNQIPTARLLYDQREIMISTEEDIKFYNALVGSYGGQSFELLTGLKESLEQKIITLEEKGLVIEFLKKFRIITPAIFAGYREAKQNHQEDLYLAELQSLADNITGAKIISGKQREKPYYMDIVKAIYQNNAGTQWTSYASNATCTDRNDDLKEFVISAKYEIDTFDAGKISLQKNESLDTDSTNKLVEQIHNIAKRAGECGYDQKKMMQNLHTDLDRAIEKITTRTMFDPLILENMRSLEDKILIISADTFYGEKSISHEEFKELMFLYEFTMHQDVRTYIQGTSDRLSTSYHQEYVLLCELHSFFDDRMKESTRKILESSWGNPVLMKQMHQYFEKFSIERKEEKKREEINKLQIEKLGLNDSFLRQIKKILEQKNKIGHTKTYTLEQVRELILRYEKITENFSAKETSSLKGRTKAIYGQLRQQKVKTLSAVKLLTGKEQPLESSSFLDIHLSNIIDQEELFSATTYHPDQFAEYTFQLINTIFDEEKAHINNELKKFVSESGTKNERVIGYITKSKESANARMVGGVCVSGDNPGLEKRGSNLWDMPNYFQMVLQDPLSKRCVGLILLHHFVMSDGEKILSASFNPSNTYLYRTDEKALFQGLTSALEIFARANNFDKIVISKSPHIRTNRTGGEFEKAMDAQVQKINESFDFEKPEVFSYKPSYMMFKGDKINEGRIGMDIIWKKT